MDPEERSPAGGSVKASLSYQTSMASGINMSPVEFEKCLWFQKNRMYVVAPEKGSTCRSKGAKGEWIEKVYDYVIAYNSLKGKISQMEVVEDFESRPHKVVSFVAKRRCRSELTKVLLGCSGGRLPGRSTKEKGREEGVLVENGEESKNRNGIAQEVVAGTKEKACTHEDAKEITQKNSWASVKQNWDCSQIESEEEEEEDDWRKENQMEVQWD